MRTGNLSTLSQRDYAAIRERREFEKAEFEKERLAEDQSEYVKYVQTVVAEQRRVPPAFRVSPIPFETWRTFADQSVADPVLRGVRATNKALLFAERKDEASEIDRRKKIGQDAVAANAPDPGWKCPTSLDSLKMPESEVLGFVRKQAEIFVAENPEYRPGNNLKLISDYLRAQGISIPNAETLKAAWLRLRELGLIEEWPAESPAPPDQPETESAEIVDDGSMEGFGDDDQPRRYSQKEIWAMSSVEFKKRFAMWAGRDGDRRPRFTRTLGQ